MVKSLHDAGIEVVLDVVYNHTAEGNQLGPTLSFRGIDNASYYRLAADKRYYDDTTGCGNTLNLRHPRVLQMVTDSLRYWVEEMHVDGFRFDLATTLAREDDGYDYNAAFFKAARARPGALARQADRRAVGSRHAAAIKSAASRPAGRNGTAAIATRCGASGGATPDVLPDLASRLAGSSDIYGTAAAARAPASTSSRVTTASRSPTSCRTTTSTTRRTSKTTATAPTTTAAGTAASKVRPTIPKCSRCANGRQRNFLATLLLSLGVPLLLAGDELGHTQRGNNNAYCQDNEISWLDWSGAQRRCSSSPSSSSCSCACAARIPPFSATRSSPAARCLRAGAATSPGYTPAGVEMTAEDWHHGGRAIGVFFGDRPLFAMFFNAGPQRRSNSTFRSPDHIAWNLAIDTAVDGARPQRAHPAAATYTVHAHAVAVFTGRLT